ncbi:MAG: serine hydrolase [Lysobacter sp.]
MNPKLATISIATISLALLAACSGPVLAMDDAALAAIAAQRLHGDRTGACFATAVIEADSVSRAFTCADPAQDGRIGPDSAFEIGSVSKTMTAALLADLIGQGKASLDEPLSSWLADGSTVPTYRGQPILLRHLVTHTSGLPRLPPGVAMVDPADPYAAMTVDDLLQALARVELASAPGAVFEYSNFASMLLSHAVARRAGQDYETLLKERIFTPLGMEGAYINQPVDGVRAADGHLPDGTITPGWTFQTDLAGVGGVRATLNDMVHYVQAQLRQRPSSMDAAFELTQRKIPHGGQTTGMNWLLAPLNGRTIHAHEGGTGGFSSFVGFDKKRQRGVVVLSDTSLTELGGLGSLALHLLDASVPLGTPLKPVQEIAVPVEELRAYAGEYPLMPKFALVIREQDGKLLAQATGQGAFELTAVAADVFAAPAYGIEIRFQRNDAGEVVALDLHQAGRVQHGERKQ